MVGRDDDYATGGILAIDFGTTSTAAAIHNGETKLLQMEGVTRLPSLVLMDSEGALVVGVAAERQAPSAPDRVERAPKRRLGDPLLLLGAQAVEPTDLVAAVLRRVAEEARRQHDGSDPSEVVLTHPVAWADTRLAALREAGRRAGLGDVTLVAEPVAAALFLADERVEVGDHIAVYDLGGGTFDTAVLRRTGSGFEPVGLPGGDERLGGEHFDDLLYRAVGRTLSSINTDAWKQLRTSEERPWVRANIALKHEVRLAKEALSSNPDYVIYIGAPVDQELRVTREELEELIQPHLERTVDAVMATIERAGLTPADLKAIYLAGGSSRIPLVTRMISERTGIVPSTWGDPKAAVALGAASRAAATSSERILSSTDAVVPHLEDNGSTDAGIGAQRWRVRIGRRPRGAVSAHRRKRWLTGSRWALALVTAIVLAVGATTFALTRQPRSGPVKARTVKGLSGSAVPAPDDSATTTSNPPTTTILPGTVAPVDDPPAGTTPTSRGPAATKPAIPSPGPGQTPSPASPPAQAPTTTTALPGPAPVPAAPNIREDVPANAPGLVPAPLPAVTSMSPPISDGFDTGLAGWTVVLNGPSPQVEHKATGGSPGGFASASDASAETTWFWEAPSRYRGNMSAYVGKTLTFDLKQSDASAPISYNSDVFLYGPDNVVLIFSTPNDPGTDWTSYRVPLDGGPGWRRIVDGVAGSNPATSDDMQFVLGGVKYLRIRGEFHYGGDIGGLDNVVFGA